MIPRLFFSLLVAFSVLSSTITAFVAPSLVPNAPPLSLAKPTPTLLPFWRTVQLSASSSSSSSNEDDVTTTTTDAAAAAAVDPFDAYQINSPSQGLVTRDLVVGSGEEIQQGDIVKVDYKGVLMASGESFGEGTFQFKYGDSSSVIQGWDQGIAGMKVGSKRLLRIPPRLGYGAKGAGQKIPPNSDLEFQVQVLDKSEGAVAEFMLKTGLGLNVRTFGMAFFLSFMIFSPMLTKILQ